MMLQLHPTHHPNEEPVHKTMHAYADTLHVTQRGANLITTMLQDNLMLEGQNSSKLEDWLIGIGTAADILTENHTHPAEAKSCGIT